MELVVEAARVADWLPVGVPAPERGGVGAAVAAAGALALRAGQSCPRIEAERDGVIVEGGGPAGQFF